MRILTLLMLLVVSGAAQTVGASGSVNFAEFDSITTFQAGETFSVDGFDFAVTPLINADGASQSNPARIGTSADLGFEPSLLLGNVLEARSVTIDFARGLGQQSSVSFSVYHGLGAVNLGVNGETLIASGNGFDAFAGFDGLMVGGVEVSVSTSSTNQNDSPRQAWITLRGPIDSIVFGGANTLFDSLLGFGPQTILLGDSNGDGAANTLDIDPFVLSILRPEQYMAQFPDVNYLNNDTNGDGRVSTLDIDGFLPPFHIISPNNKISPAPEPGGRYLIVAGAVSLCVRRWRHKPTQL